MFRALRLAWWTLMEARACAKVRHHRVELTVWIVQRDRYRQRLAAARKASGPFSETSLNSTLHLTADDAPKEGRA